MLPQICFNYKLIFFFTYFIKQVIIKFINLAESPNLSLVSYIFLNA